MLNVRAQVSHAPQAKALSSALQRLGSKALLRL
jgi:hypothetical protein